MMSAYNRLNGHYASENPWLLDRKCSSSQWGYDGVVRLDLWCRCMPRWPRSPPASTCACPDCPQGHQGSER